MAKRAFLLAVVVVVPVVGVARTASPGVSLTVHPDNAVGRIDSGRWYRMRVRCEGRHLQIWLDKHWVIDYTDDQRGSER